MIHHFFIFYVSESINANADIEKAAEAGENGLDPQILASTCDQQYPRALGPRPPHETHYLAYSFVSNPLFSMHCRHHARSSSSNNHSTGGAQCVYLCYITYI